MQTHHEPSAGLGYRYSIGICPHQRPPISRLQLQSKSIMWKGLPRNSWASLPRDDLAQKQHDAMVAGCPRRCGTGIAQWGLMLFVTAAYYIIM